MADCAGSRENLPGLAHVTAVVAPETPWPVTVTYVMGIGGPVDFHREEDAAVEDGCNGIDGLVDFCSLISENLVEMLAVIPFNRLPYALMGALAVFVIFQQGLNGKLLDPGQSSGDITPSHCLVNSSSRWCKYVRGPIMTMHTIHQVDRELLQFILRDIDLLVFVNHFRTIGEYHSYPRNLLKLRVHGSEVYFAASDHVPVNACILTYLRNPSPCFHQKAQLLRGIFLIVTKIRYLK
jgi:hypothetical protein